MDSFADEDRNIVPAAQYGMTGDWPLELLIRVDFTEERGRTRMTLQHTGFPPGDDQEQAKTGWNESFDRLAELLAGE